MISSSTLASLYDMTKMCWIYREFLEVVSTDFRDRWLLCEVQEIRIRRSIAVDR